MSGRKGMKGVDRSYVGALPFPLEETLVPIKGNFRSH